MIDKLIDHYKKRISYSAIIYQTKSLWLIPAILILWSAICLAIVMSGFNLFVFLLIAGSFLVFFVIIILVKARYIKKKFGISLNKVSGFVEKKSRKRIRKFCKKNKWDSILPEILETLEETIQESKANFYFFKIVMGALLLPIWGSYVSWFISFTNEESTFFNMNLGLLALIFITLLIYGLLREIHKMHEFVTSDYAELNRLKRLLMEYHLEQLIQERNTNIGDANS